MTPVVVVAVVGVVVGVVADVVVVVTVPGLGDGVQAIHDDDPGVVTISVHESGRTLFPGTGFADELGHGAAALAIAQSIR